MARRSIGLAVSLLAAAMLAHPVMLPGDGSNELLRVTTIVPFPRGLALVDDKLHVLSRGRVRGAGGVSAEIEDRAGTIFVVDQSVTQPASEAEVSDAVRQNGSVFALPTSPPFRLWNRSATPPSSDRETDRPYCGLRWHEPTRSFYICAFSGIDKSRGAGGRSFSKNLSDAVLRYDTRTSKWYEVERHDIEAGGIYPHSDPAVDAPPHGWLNGPDNILPVGMSLYAVAKDNSILVRYDLSSLVDDPEAGAPRGEWVMQDIVSTTNAGELDLQGHSALAEHDGWLYVATRTSSHIVRLKLDDEGLPVTPLVVELVALFDPWTRESSKSADITDMAFDSKGRLYVVSAEPARVYRFAPDPDRIYDARGGRQQPWLDFAAATNNPAMKSENVLISEDDVLYLTSGDGYAYQAGAAGVVYRVKLEVAGTIQ